MNNRTLSTIIVEAFGSVSKFNALAGNLENVSDASINAQIGFIFEALCETIAGWESSDKVELLDGACDVFVTAAGLGMQVRRMLPGSHREDGKHFAYQTFAGWRNQSWWNRQFQEDFEDVDEVDIMLTTLHQQLEDLLRFTDKTNPEFVRAAYAMVFPSVKLLQILEKLGYNVAEALTRVNANNLSKFPEVLHASDTDDWACTWNDNFERWVLKDENGKVRKPRGFAPVDIEDCVPR